MASVIYGSRAIADLERLAEFLWPNDPVAAEKTGPLIMGAIRALATHPLLGARVSGGTRQLVISRGRTGYIALYTFDPQEDRVVIHAIRHQREAGFEDD